MAAEHVLSPVFDGLFLQFRGNSGCSVGLRIGEHVRNYRSHATQMYPLTKSSTGEALCSKSLWNAKVGQPPNLHDPAILDAELPWWVSL